MSRLVRLCTGVLIGLLSSGLAAAQELKNPFDGVTGALTTEDTRLTTGIESVNAASSESKEHMLIDFMLTAPLQGPAVTRTAKPWTTAWLNARFNGSPSTTVSGIKQFVGGFQSELVSGDTSTLLNTLAFRAGLEIKIPRMNGVTFGKDYQFQPVFIGSVGIQTVPALSKPAVFDISDQARKRWGITDAAVKYVALTDPDRRRFYRAYELGVRLKTHHFDDCDSGPVGCDRNRRVNFPGVVDLTLGQDSSITGGIRRGIVGRVDAFYPLPTDNLANAIYLFGAARVHWLKAVDAEQDPLILRAPTATVALPSAEVAMHTLTADERTRDEWKFGLGVDLVRLFTAAAEGRNKDEAALAVEDGSHSTIYDGPEVTVDRRILQKGETRTFSHGVDVLVPLRTATLEAQSIPAGSSETVNFVAGEPQVELAVRRKLKNPSDDEFQVLVLRIKPGEAKGDMGAFTLTPANGTETVIKVDDSRYKVSKITCSATCDLASAATVDNVLVVVPVKDTTISVGGEMATTRKGGEPVIVQRKSALAVSGAAELVVLRLR